MRIVRIPTTEEDSLRTADLIPLSKVYCASKKVGWVELALRTHLPDYAIYLGRIESGQVPEIIMEDNGNYLLVFKKD